MNPCNDSAYFAQQMLDLETGDSSASRDSPHPARVARAKSNAMLSRVFPAGVIFAALDPSDFRRPPSPRPTTSPVRRWEYPSSSYWGIPYRHMCRFFGCAHVLPTPRLLAPFPLLHGGWTPTASYSQPQRPSAPLWPAVMARRPQLHSKPLRWTYLRKCMQGAPTTPSPCCTPQTIPTFLTNLWETYDSFIRARKQRGRRSKARRCRLPRATFRPHSRGAARRGPSLLGQRRDF